MTNVSRALMEDHPTHGGDFLQRQSAALVRRDAKLEEERAKSEAEALRAESASMRPTPEITETASRMRRTVDDLRAWQDRKDASVKELRRRRDEYEDRVHNTFAPRMSKGSVAIERERRNAALAKYRSSTNSAGSSPGAKILSPSAKSPGAKSPGVEPSPHSHESFDDETLAGARARTRRVGDAWLSPEPLVRDVLAAPTPTPMTHRAVTHRASSSSTTNGAGGADAMAAVLAGAAMAGAAALAARTTAGAPKPEAAAEARQPAGGGSGTTFPSENFRRRTSASMGTSIRNSVRVPRAAAGHYTRNPAAVPPAAMTLDDERSTTFAPRITAKASSLRRSGDFGDRMHRAAVEAANEKASVSPGATRRRGPRGVGVGTRGSGVDSGVREIHGNSWTRGDSNRGASGDEAWGPARSNLAHAPAVSPVGTPGARGRRSSSVLEALARRKSGSRDGSRSTPDSSPRLRGRSRATKRLDHRHRGGGGDATATEGDGEYWTAAGEDSAGEFGDLGTDPDAFVATALAGS